MADVPRDPRQLARDILSGKVKIEDLARERQMRGGGAVGGGGTRVPDKIPLPRPVQAKPAAQIPRPVQRAPVPARPQQPRPVQQQRTMTPPQARIPQQQKMQPALRPPLTVPASSQRPVPPPVLPGPPVAQQTYGVAGAAALVPDADRPSVSLAALLKNKAGMRQGIVLSEILGKPVGLRELE